MARDGHERMPVSTHMQPGMIKKDGEKLAEMIGISGNVMNMVNGLKCMNISTHFNLEVDIGRMTRMTIVSL